jgi:hypothetical protein
MPTRQLIVKLTVDFELLRQQKAWLLCHSSDEAEGLLGLVDAMQDQAVAAGVATEAEVFARGE